MGGVQFKDATGVQATTVVRVDTTEDSAISMAADAKPRTMSAKQLDIAN
jgi:hypothetical protein